MVPVKVVVLKRTDLHIWQPGTARLTTRQAVIIIIIRRRIITIIITVKNGEKHKLGKKS